MIAKKSSSFDWIINQISHNKKIEFQRIGNWILAGSGNYEKTQHDGRYRESCNTYRGAKTCEDHKMEAVKPIFTRCRKLDCETCFTAAASERARGIENKLLSFKESAENEDIDIGEYCHIILSCVKEVSLAKLRSFDVFKSFRREAMNILKDNGIKGGVMINHVWALQCKNCGRNLDKCICHDKDLEAIISHHFHIIGFGYIRNIKKFRKKHPEWVYVNKGRRKELYDTLFYDLTHCAMWRRSDGGLNPSYTYFGWLHPRKCSTKQLKAKWKAETCPKCKKVLKEVIEGVQVTGDHPQFTNNAPMRQRAKKLGITTAGRSLSDIKKRLDQCILNNQNFQLHAIEKKMRLGNEIKYKTIVKEYEITDIEGLREEVAELRIRHEHGRKLYEAKLKKRKEKESNGYG